ncbi:MAG: carboxypeptidase-like regulatory domain-containing protein, partial [Planctomycetota bacterium]
AAPAAAPPRPEHTLRGRIVDAAGQPLAGIQAGLTGWTGNSQRLAAWTKDNAEPARIDQKATTGPDGVFTFRCWPPPPFQFSLRLQGTGFAMWGQRWHEWAPGGTTDLGDVQLERGTLLRGRVVDAAGAPVAKVEVRIDGNPRGGTAGGSERWATARTGDDGNFVQRWPLPAGEYTIGIDDQQIERGDKVTLTGEAEQSLEVVLKRIDPASSISGVVVDDAGAPIRSVTVHPFMSGSGRIISTDAQGRFRVLKREGAPAEVTLTVSAHGFEGPPSQEKYAWGRHDLRIVMTRGKELTVLAVRADDGTPVEDYVLRVIPTGGGFSSSLDREPRGKPPHQDGRATVAGIRTGKHRVVVEPRGDGFAIGVVQVEVGPAGAPPVTVRLAATSPRVVRVVVADGTPVAGAKVQLVDPGGEPWTSKVPVFALASSSFTSGPQALELAAAVTDGNGDCTLPVPGDRPLALMLPGPGHVPHAVPQAVFPAEGPLAVTVSKGAVLRGKLGPEAAWAELQRLATREGDARRSNTNLPWIALSRGDGQAREQFPDFRTRLAVNQDGSFELTGIPPGQWSVSVNYFRFQGGGGSGKQEAAGTVDLVDGQVTTIAPDLSALLPGTLEALVLHGGAPLANTMVGFERLVAGATWPQQESGLTTDADGRLRAALRAGDYRTTWMPPRANGSSSTLRSVETAIVRVGETTRQTFTIVSGTLKVRLVDSSGAPVANVHIGLTDAAGAETGGLGATGADGRVEIRYPPGTFTAWVAPKRLQDQKALMEFYRTNTDPAAMQRLRVSLGTLTVGDGATSEVELKLPAEW